MKTIPSWMPSWDQKSIIRLPVDKLAEVTSKNTKTLKVLQGFWAPRHSNFEAKLTNIRPQSDQKSSKKLINILTQFLIDFWSNLDPFGEDFGFQVGTKLGPNAIKARFQNQSKKRLLFGRPLDRFWVDFGCLLAGCGSTKCFLGVLLALGGSFGRTS